MGRIISQSGVEVDPEAVRAVERMKKPSSLKDLWAFLDLVSYYRKNFLFRKNSQTSLQVIK